MFLSKFYDTITIQGYNIILCSFLAGLSIKDMKSDEKRSHRLNYLLKCYLSDPHETSLYQRAKQMGVSDSTAKDYIRTVIIQAQKIYSR